MYVKYLLSIQLQVVNLIELINKRKYLILANYDGMDLGYMFQPIAKLTKLQGTIVILTCSTVVVGYVNGIKL